MWNKINFWIAIFALVSVGIQLLIWSVGTIIHHGIFASRSAAYIVAFFACMNQAFREFDRRFPNVKYKIGITRWYL